MNPRIIYLGSTSSTDCDFPLLKEMKRRGIDVVAYYPISEWNKRRGLIAVEEMIPRDAIFKASDVPAFAIYGDYVDLDNIYVINAYHYKRYDPRSWWVWLKALRHMQRQHADIFHTVWPLDKIQKLLYLLKGKRVVTVHDPLPHSGLKSSYDEKCRRKAFTTADKVILLSTPQVDEFQLNYGISKDKIVVSKLGEYDCLKCLKPDASNVPQGRYVLFFGQIQSHKGVDILLEAMKRVHEKYPDVKVVVAGKGEFHFDIEPFQKLDYVDIRNYYITVPELAGLLQNCLFAVCPYRDATQSGVVQTAFSADVPLIVTNVGALPEAVTDGVTGLVVPPSDPEALAQAIEKLIATPELVAEFRANIDKLWRPSMMWGPIVEQYINCYKELTR